MTVRTVLPRAALAAVAAATTLAPAPAHAVPLYQVAGSGRISPGLTLLPTEQSFWFSGTGTTTTVPLGQYPCSFSGSATVPGPNSMAGPMSGACGPTTYASCVYTLTTSTWDFTCTNLSLGTFVVTPLDMNPTTAFSAIGTVT